MIVKKGPRVQEPATEKPTSVSTIAVHGGDDVQAANPPKVAPIYQSSVFVFDDLDHLARFQEGSEPGTYIYTRLGNPNPAALEELVAQLEGAPEGVASASGLGAISAALLGQLSAGDHLIVTHEMYGGTYSLIFNELQRLGIRITSANFTDLDTVERAIRPETRVFYVETMSNPTLTLTDIEAVANLARRHGIKVIVDNTFASPYLIRPLSLGAHAVVHSATKFLGGHSDLTAGVVAGDKDITGPARRVMTNFGSCLSPFEAWLAVRGIRTLHLRMERHCQNAMLLAKFLHGHPNVLRVYYPGLPDFPQRELAQRLLPKGFGGMLSFDVRGGLAAANRVMGNLRLAKFAPSLAGVATTTSHPAKTSHKYLPEEERLALGITDGMIRVSVGIEEASDIIDDFRRALESIG